MSFFIFLLILSILILVHEWGHYIAARKCGVKVEQFALGFGPRLFSWRRGDTEFCLCAIPLGGFVKMAGDERDKLSGNAHEYFSKPAGQRALIVVMGPVVNLVLAYLCFWAMFMIGFVDMEQSSKNVAPVIGQIVEKSPAQKAGLQVGDKVVKVNGTNVDHWTQLQESVSTSTAEQVALTVQRVDQEMTVNVIPEETTKKDIFGRDHKTRRIGVGPTPITEASQMVITRYGFFESFVKAGEELWKITIKTYAALYEMAIGARSPKEAMGIIGMFFVIKFALSVSFAFVLHIVGVISASLAIFNLLPIIPLDGGHLFLIALEKIRGKALSVKADQWVAKAGFAFIIILALFVFYSDFERIGWIDKIANLLR